MNDLKINERDYQLDAYRALVMIYIVCYIHVCFWLGLGSEPIQSLTLVEMPVIFFISGAALSVTKARKSFVHTCMNRFVRVMVPYYVYAFIISIYYIFAYLKII